MIGFIVMCLLFVAGIITIIVGACTEVGRDYNVSIYGLIALVLALIILPCSTIVKVNPDEVGISYVGQNKTTLHTGYNITAPWAIVKTWTSKATVVTYSEGEGIDNIYGAQTSEKDYIQVVATVSARVDVNRLDDYISRYGDSAVDSDKLQKVIKSVSRTAIEKVIGSYTTSDVMSKKSKINDEAKTEFLTMIAEQPILIDSFTIDDLVAPDSYEQMIKDQASLRQQTEKAELQKKLNETEAEANKIKAEGEATVAKTNAEKEAAVKKINAEANAEAAKIDANSKAEVVKIDANAEAEKITIKAKADADAVVLAGEAEAKAKTALSDIYKNNPELYELAVKEIDAEIQKEWAEKWSGYDFNGMSSVSFANVSDILNSILSNNKGE